MKNLSSSDIAFFTICIIVGILSTILCIGLGMQWYNDWNPTTLSASLVAWPTIVFCMGLIDFVIWIFIVGFIGVMFFDWGDSL